MISTASNTRKYDPANDDADFEEEALVCGEAKEDDCVVVDERLLDDGALNTELDVDDVERLEVVEGREVAVDAEETTPDWANSSMRLAALSSTQRFPLESKTIPSGPESWDCEGVDTFELNPGTPITRLAFSPLVKGAGNSKTLPLKVSVTHRFPEASKVVPAGEDNRL